MGGRPLGARSGVRRPVGLWERNRRAGAGAFTGLPSTVTPWSEDSNVAGVSTGLPPMATRPSAIIRSISRREAMPARARSLAIRWPSRGASDFGGRGGDRADLLGPAQRAEFCAQPLARRDTSPHLARYAGRIFSQGVARPIMLFGKRERAIRRIVIVEDEPLVAFDNEHLLRESGYEVVATVDSLAEAVRVLGEDDDIHLVLCD